MKKPWRRMRETLMEQLSIWHHVICRALPASRGQVEDMRARLSGLQGDLTREAHMRRRLETMHRILEAKVAGCYVPCEHCARTGWVEDAELIECAHCNGWGGFRQDSKGRIEPFSLCSLQEYLRDNRQ